MAPLTGLTDRIHCALREHLARIRQQPDAGYSTETVIWTALLALLAIAAAAVIYGKVIARARGIHLQ